MKKIAFLLIICIPIIISAQSENFKPNDCFSQFEISFYNRPGADYAHDRHTNPNHDEIHIIIEENGFIFNGNSFSRLDKMHSNLIEYQENRTFITDYYFTIGICNSAPFYILQNLFCELEEISKDIPSTYIVKLYTF